MSDYEGKLLCRIAELERQLAAQAEDASVGRAIQTFGWKDSITRGFNTSEWLVIRGVAGLGLVQSRGVSAYDALRAAGLLPEKAVTV